MNKKLFEKVNGLCKDTGLSEKYLKEITEKMGGSIEDDSTDDDAIESTANPVSYTHLDVYKRQPSYNSKLDSPASVYSFRIGAMSLHPASVAGIVCSVHHFSQSQNICV